MSQPNPQDPPSWTPVDDPAHNITLEQNWLFHLRRERFQSRATGKTHDYYVLQLADAVNVVALTTDRQLLLVRQFRAGNKRDSLETPGGLVDPGEDPRAAAARELLEETGYQGAAAQLLGQVWSNPSILSSRTYFVLIDQARKVANPAWDHAEELVIEQVPEQRIATYLQEGKVDHALSTCALLWWLATREQGPLASRSRP